MFPTEWPVWRMKAFCHTPYEEQLSVLYHKAGMGNSSMLHIEPCPVYIFNYFVLQLIVLRWMILIPILLEAIWIFLRFWIFRKARPSTQLTAGWYWVACLCILFVRFLNLIFLTLVGGGVSFPSTFQSNNWNLNWCKLNFVVSDVSAV